MFVDASAFMAILLAEDDGDEIFGRIQGSKRRPSTSPVVRFEVVMSVARSAAKNGKVSPADIAEAEAAFDELLSLCSNSGNNGYAEHRPRRLRTGGKVRSALGPSGASEYG